MAAFSIAPFGREQEHAAALKRGLARMVAGFTAEICGLCDGTGQYRQMYCDGPNGYYRAMGGCDWCDGTGLRQGKGAAPASVRAQVLNASSDKPEMKT